MSLQAYQEKWFQNQITQTGQKIQRDQSKLECGNKLQVGQSTLQNQKGQKNITFLSAVLKDSAGIVETKTAPNHFYPEFEILMNLSQNRACTKADKQSQIEAEKQDILAHQLQEIKIANDHLYNCQQITTNLFQSSFSIFRKGQGLLNQKLEAIGNFKEEEENKKIQIDQFERGMKDLDFNSLESVQNVFNQIDNQENGRNYPNYMQQGSQIGQARNTTEIQRLKNELLNDRTSSMIYDSRQSDFRNLDRCLPGRAAQQNAVIKSYTQQDIGFICSKLLPDQPDKMFKVSHNIEKQIDDLKKNMENKVKQKLLAKRANLDHLVDFTKSQVKSFLLQLPLDYFQREGDKILKHFKLPKYEQLSSLQSLPVKVEAFSISFSVEDLKRLQQENLINDNLLECYSLYLSHCHQYLKFNKDKQKKSQYEGDIIFFSQLFFESLFDGTRIKEQEAIRFINNVVPINDLFNSQIVNRFGFIVNVDLYNIKHWIFFGVFNTTREIVYYDSAEGSSSTYFKNISDALKSFFLSVGGANYTVKKQDACPRQQNGADCGMFVMKFIQNFAYGSEQKFNQAQVTALRKKLYTFFPLLAYQLAQDSLDFDLLQYYEDRFSTKSEKYCEKFQSNFNQVAN